MTTKITKTNGAINKIVPEHKLQRYLSEGWEIKEEKKTKKKAKKKKGN